MRTEPLEIEGTKEKKNVRKRVAKSKEWKENVRKHQCQSGKEYMSRRGKVVAERKILDVPACQRCLFKCTSHITKTERNSIFQTYYGLGLQEKKHFLIKNTDRILTSRPSKSSLPSRRHYTFRYFFIIKGEKVKVCKTFFLATLCISQKPIYTAHQNKSVCGTPKSDGRGKASGSRRALSSDILQKVHDHINSFPQVESHYCRENTQRKYLDSSLNVAKMYDLYVQYCNNENVMPVKAAIYRKVFNTAYNLGFHFPKSDRCDMCEAYKNAEKYDLITSEQKCEYENHITAKESMRHERLTDKEGRVPVLSFDLQNVISCPRAEISSFFYRRKLNVYNLTAQLSSSKTVYCALWPETSSGRSGNDLASAMKKIMERVIEENEITDLITWCDSCVPQNRNSFMSNCMMDLIRQNQNLSSVTMKFSVPGHSCIQEIDNIHSSIEKMLRRTEIYSPLGLIKLLKTVNRKRPYRVLQMRETDFYDYASTAKLLNYKNVPFSKVAVLKFTRILPEVQYKLNHSQSEFETVNIRHLERPRRCGSQKEQKKDPLPQVFLARPPVIRKTTLISAAKVNDLKLMLKFMPPEDQEYYKTELKF